MADLSTAPDDTPLVPEGRCGHTLNNGNAAFNCTALGAHVVHTFEGKGYATREGMGTADRVPVMYLVAWEDPRPAGTVGDIRRILRHESEVRRG